MAAAALALPARPLPLVVLKSPALLASPEAASSSSAQSHSSGSGAPQAAVHSLAHSPASSLVSLSSPGRAPSTEPSPAQDSAGATAGDAAAELPPLARELGVRLGVIARLLRADAACDADAPVWMVVNLQGKIKGSYTAEKMLDFVRRGTLSAPQLVLGIDKDLPYVARQELAYYRPLGALLTSLAAPPSGELSYQPLAQAHVTALAARGGRPADWQPLVPCEQRKADALAAGLSGLCLEATGTPSLGGPGSASQGSTGISGPRLRAALQRLCSSGCLGSGGAEEPGRGGLAGAKPAMWLYLNHLGWCRGPFSGGKMVHAHLCGRLPRDTLVAAFDPEVPSSMISGSVQAWFRPLGALLDNVANGWAYNPVRMADVVQHGAAGVAFDWHPLSWQGPGSPPSLLDAAALAPPPALAGRGVAGAGRRGAPCSLQGVPSQTLGFRAVSQPLAGNAAGALAQPSAQPGVYMSVAQPRQLMQPALVQLPRGLQALSQPMAASFQPELVLLNAASSPQPVAPHGPDFLQLHQQQQALAAGSSLLPPGLMPPGSSSELSAYNLLPQSQPLMLAAWSTDCSGHGANAPVRFAAAPQGLGEQWLCHPGLAQQPWQLPAGQVVQTRGLVWLPAGVTLPQATMQEPAVQQLSLAWPQQHQLPQQAVLPADLLGWPGNSMLN